MLLHTKAKTYTVPSEVAQKCNPNTPLGRSIRIRHNYRMDGTICSLHKDAAANLQRVTDGWLFNCFRCNLSGFIPIDDQSISNTQKMLKRTQIKMKDYKKLDSKVIMPSDIKFLPQLDSETMIKLTNILAWAYSGISMGNITAAAEKIQNTLQDKTLGYSENYNRVIVPLFYYHKNPDSGEIIEELMGWTGRAVESKFELPLDERSRWIKWLHYIPSKHRGRTYYHERSKNNELQEKGPMVLVEDPFSAMKVNMNTGFYSVALLNDKINSNLIADNTHRPIIIWLDGDRKKEALTYVKRFSSWHYFVKTIYSKADPKWIPKPSMIRCFKEIGVHVDENNTTGNICSTG